MQVNLQTSAIISLFVFVTALLIFSAYLALPDKLQPFTSDGCSAFPDGNVFTQIHWKKCCTAHDYAYWQGGIYEQRLQADLELEKCVAKVGEPEIAKLMLAGVRVGGTPYLPTSFRWGYGWKYPRPYKALTTKELQLVEQLIAKPTH